MAVEPRRSVHICNIPPYPLSEIEDLLFELFLQLGPVNKVFVPYEKENGVHKGYAFVEFLHEESVPYTCKMMHGIKLLGTYLVVRPAVSRIEQELMNNKMDEQEPSNNDGVLVVTDTDAVSCDNQVMSSSFVDTPSSIVSNGVLTNSVFASPVTPPCPPGPMGLFCPPFPPPPLPFPMQAPPIPQLAPPIPPHYLPFLPSPYSFNNSFTPPIIPMTPPIMDMAPPIMPPPAIPISDTRTLLFSPPSSSQGIHSSPSLLETRYNTLGNNPFKSAAQEREHTRNLALHIDNNSLIAEIGDNDERGNNSSTRVTDSDSPIDDCYKDETVNDIEVFEYNHQSIAVQDR